MFMQLLLSGKSDEVTLTRYQTSCLLALAFFCLLDKPKRHGARFQRLSLIEILEYGFFRSQSSKCFCIIGYFDRLRQEESSGNQDYLKRCITIKRKVLSKEENDVPFWKSCDLSLGEFEISDGCFIESFDGCLQVDFANEYIGGGVLQQGNVQVRREYMYMYVLLQQAVQHCVHFAYSHYYYYYYFSFLYVFRKKFVLLLIQNV